MSKVRVDFFRPTGKWYTTEEMDWSGTNKDVNYAFAESLRDHLKSGLGYRLDDMVAVCLSPDHEFKYPIMMPVDKIFSYLQVDDSGAISTEHDIPFDAFMPFEK